MVRTRWLEMAVIWFHSFCCCSLCLSSFIRQKKMVDLFNNPDRLADQSATLDWLHSIMKLLFANSNSYYIYSYKWMERRTRPSSTEYTPYTIPHRQRSYGSCGRFVDMTAKLNFIWIIYVYRYLDGFKRILITIEATPTKEKTKNFKWITFLGKTQKRAKSVNFMNFSHLSYKSRGIETISKSGAPSIQKNIP